MGLFDFLKKKPEDAQPTPPATPATAPTSSPVTEPEAPKAPAGPRYQRPDFAASAPPTMQPVAPTPQMPPMPVPPMPPVPAFEPANALEEVLLRAAQEPELRLAFYHELLQAEVLVLLVQPEGTPAGEVTIEEGTEVQLHVLHDGRIPLFSSEARIHDAGNVEGTVHFLRMRGEALLRMAQGAEFVLNPFSPFGKLLVAQEVEDLLTGRLFAPPAGEDGQPPQVQLRQIEDMPAELRTGLEELFATVPAIRAAFMAVMQIPQPDTPPRLLLAFDMEGEDMAFLEQLGPVLRGHIAEQDTIDVVRLSADPNEPLTQYFSQQEPFYRQNMA